MLHSDELQPPPKEKHEANGWRVPLPSTGYRRPLVGGLETAVYSDSLRAGTTLARCRQPYGEIVILGEGAILELTIYNHGNHAVHRIIGGRHVVFLAPNVWHSYRCERDGEIMVVYARRTFLNKHLPGRVWSGIVIGEFVLVASKDALIWRVTSLCRSACDEGHPAERKLIEQLGHALARRTLVSNFAASEPSAKLPVFNVAQQTVIFDYMEARIKQVPSNTELARLVSLSTLYFSRLFKNTTGMSPRRYQNTCRLRRAEQMVLSGKYRIKEIARELGFSSVSYFDRRFREFFGGPPHLHAAHKSATESKERAMTRPEVSGQVIQ